MTGEGWRKTTRSWNFEIFKTHANDNVTGKVKELVTSFEKLGCSGVNLKSKNHESRFKESIGKSYLSPEKRQKVSQNLSTSNLRLE